MTPDIVSSPVTAPDPPPKDRGSDAALDQLLRQIITGFFVLTDGQGAVSKWSDPAELLFGLETDKALGQPFFGKVIRGRLAPRATAGAASSSRARPRRYARAPS